MPRERDFKKHEQVNLAPVNRLPDEDAAKLESLVAALDSLAADERYHLRRITKVEAVFSPNGNVSLKVHRDGDTAAIYTHVVSTDPKIEE